MKSSVFFAHLNVPESILNAAPSDGSSSDEKQTNKLGASYDELEWAMLEAEAGKTTDFSGRQKTVFEIYKG
jgi:NAD+ synthase